MSDDVYTSLAKVLVGLYFEKNPEPADSGFGFLAKVLEPLDQREYGVKAALNTIQSDSNGISLIKKSGGITFSRNFKYEEVPSISNKEDLTSFVENILRENVF